MPYQEATAKLQELIRRKDRVLSVMHPPSAALARVMEAAGAEAGFVGTSGVVGSYTGLEDVGTATLSECILIAGWIARAVSFPVILDGDTGHGGVMAVRRMVECALESNAGVVGPKVLDGSDPRHLEDMGSWVDRYGAAVPRFEPGELDQGQYDADREVFATSESALLVRSDLFEGNLEDL